MSIRPLLARCLSCICLVLLQAFSPAGRCKTFDASADGYGRGEGCAAVILAPAAAADSQAEPIAVLQSSVVNQDGRSSSLTAPNGPSQTALISTAISTAGQGPAILKVLDRSDTACGDGLQAPILCLMLHISSSNLVLGSCLQLIRADLMW